MNLPNKPKAKYTKHQHQVGIVNDIYDGVDTARNHLLKYSQEEEPDFKGRVSACILDNFVFRTVDTMKNVVFRKDIDTEGVKNTLMQGYIEKIDLSNNIDYFAKQVFDNSRKDGFTFILADTQTYDPKELNSKQKAQEAGVRPYLANILRSNVINWQGDDINFSDWVVLKECVTEYNGSEFDEKEVIQYRVIYANGMMKIFKEDSEKMEVLRTAKRSKPILTKVGNEDIPEFYDMAKININHLNRNSELDNYVRIGGAPFLAIGGSQDSKEGEVKTIGINSGLQFTDENFKVEWIEMSGANSEMIRNRIKDYEIAMMNQSIEFLTSDSNLTATQVNKESAPKESKLKSYSRELEDGLNEALADMGSLVTGGLGENTIVINKDFDNAILTDEEAQSLREDYINNVITLEELREAYYRGERLNRLSPDEEAKMLAILKDQGTLQE